jgi:hypothetical protein
VLFVVDDAGTGGTGQQAPTYARGIRRNFSSGGRIDNSEIWVGMFWCVDLIGPLSNVTKQRARLRPLQDQ